MKKYQQNDASQALIAILNGIESTIPTKYNSKSEPPPTIHTEYLKNRITSQDHQLWNLSDDIKFYDQLKHQNKLNKDSDLVKSFFDGIEVIEVCNNGILCLLLICFGNLKVSCWCLFVQIGNMFRLSQTM